MMAHHVFLRVWWILLVAGGGVTGSLITNWGVLTQAASYTPGESADAGYADFAKPFLVSHCVDCHGETEPEAGLSLVTLGPVDELNAETWKSIWAQVALQEMPPPDAALPEVLSLIHI